MMRLFLAGRSSFDVAVGLIKPRDGVLKGDAVDTRTVMILNRSMSCPSAWGGSGLGWVSPEGENASTSSRLKGACADSTRLSICSRKLEANLRTRTKAAHAWEPLWRDQSRSIRPFDAINVGASASTSSIRTPARADS